VLECLPPPDIDVEVFAALSKVRVIESLGGESQASLPAGDLVVEIGLSEELRQGEIERLRKEISRVEAEVRRAEGKLANDKFVQNAPADIVAAEREKLQANAAVQATLATRLDEYL